MKVKVGLSSTTLPPELLNIFKTEEELMVALKQKAGSDPVFIDDEVGEKVALVLVFVTMKLVVLVVVVVTMKLITKQYIMCQKGKLKFYLNFKSQSQFFILIIFF